MEFSPTTFLLEVLNFLVLAWLLKRFLYRPVKESVERRRRAVEQTLEQAAAAGREAAALREEYAGHLAAWEGEHRHLAEELHQALVAERARRLADLAAELERERERDRALATREIDRLAAEATRAAMDQGARFAARLLAELAGPEQQGPLLRLLTGQLADLDPARRQTLRNALADGTAPVQIVSAHPLGPAEREAVGAALTEVAGTAVAAQFSEDPDLIAGLRVHAGALVLKASLRDEVEEFARAGDAA